MQSNFIRVNGIVFPSNKGQNISSESPSSEEEEPLFDVLAESLLNNYRTMIVSSNNKAKTKKQHINGNGGFYENLTNDFLSNFPKLNTKC